MSKRAELLSNVQREYDLLEKLGGIREEDKQRLYNVLASPSEAAKYSKPHRDEQPRIDELFRPDVLMRDSHRMVCAQEYVQFVMDFAGVKVRKGLTQKLHKRLTNKIWVLNGRLYFDPCDTSDVFDCLIAVLRNNRERNPSSDMNPTFEVINGLIAQKPVIISRFHPK